MVDTSSAGDAFNAAFAVALAVGESLEKACEAGSDAGARIMRGPGFVDALSLWGRPARPGTASAPGTTA